MASLGGVPLLDFSALANLPDEYRKARQQATRERTLAELGQGTGDLDYGNAARKLLAAGDVQGATTLASLARDARDFAFRQQEAQRSQRNTERGFGLQERQIGSGETRDVRDFGFRREESQRAQTNTDRALQLQRQQAEEAARGFEYREIDDGMGGKKLVRIVKATGQIEAPPIAGMQTEAQNPFVEGKMNESQSKDALYARRMFASEKVLRDVEQVGTNWMERRKGDVSNVTGYNVRSPEYQKFDQAQRDFINATLRRESGAVISPAEFDNANKQYFPMPGDTPDVIKQKRLNRVEAIKGIAAGAGPGYRPPYTFDPEGELVERPAKGVGTPAGSLPAGTTPQQAVTEAREAIAKNPAARDAVIQRLKGWGINAPGL